MNKNIKIGFKLHFEDKTVFVDRDSLDAVCTDGKKIYKASVDGAEVLWAFEKWGTGDIVSLSIKGNKPLGIKRIDSVVFNIGVPKKTDRIVFLGRSFLKNETRYPWELGTDIEYPIDCLSHLEDLTQKGPVIAGISPFRNIYASVAVKNTDGSFTFSAKTEYTVDMLQSNVLSTERVFFIENASLDELFDLYRPLLPVSKFPMPKLTGWNSWDYYLDNVTADDVMENAAALSKMPFSTKLDYIVIDDGWQKDWGIWRENDKFSCGLKTVADNIKKAGFLPGIWMAPLSVSDSIPLAQEHKDWFCLTEPNKHYIDPTIPEAEEFILDNYRYQYEAGFRLFKMDYVSPILKVKKFYDKNATAYSALSRLVERVKECTGPDAVVLGCSLPVECGPDVAPSMRISVDIHNFFPHVERIAQAMQWAWMFNNRITRIDVDFLVVRGDETSDDDELWKYINKNNFAPPPRYKQTDDDRMKSFWRHGDMFNALEAETWANLVCISGGNIFMSDRMSRLNSLGVDIIDRSFKLAGDEVRPVFQKNDKRIASLWKGDKGMLIINWEDTPQSIVIDNIDFQIESDKDFSLENGKLTVLLLPHESFAATYKL